MTLKNAAAQTEIDTGVYLDSADGADDFALVSANIGGRNGLAVAFDCRLSPEHTADICAEADAPAGHGTAEAQTGIGTELLCGKRGADVAFRIGGEQIIAKFQPYKVLLVVGVCEVPLEYLLVGRIDFGKGAVLSVIHFNYLASAEIGSHGNVERADGDGQQVQHNHSVGQFWPALNLQFSFRELLQTARSVEVVCVACVKRGIDVEVWHLDKTGPDLDELANRHGDVRADAGRAGIYADGKMVEEVCVPRHLRLQGKADEGECEEKRKSFHDVRSVVFMLNSAQS